MSEKERKTEFSYKKTTSFYFLYTFFVFILAHCIWPIYQLTEFSMYQYVLDFQMGKFFVCLVIALIMTYIVSNRYSNKDSFSSRTVLLLTILYFIPGIAISSALNNQWSYISMYVVYYFVFIIADSIIAMPKKPASTLKKNDAKFLFFLMVVVCLIYPFVLMAIYEKGFSMGEIIEALNDPYGVRAQAREQGISWAFLLLENWCVYFGAVMITYSLKKKKYVFAILFVCTEIFYFSLQGNRIYLFITAIAILLGILKINNKRLALAIFLLMVIQFAEFWLFGNRELGLIGNVYRRFSMVPNIISPHYYEYFSTHTPDFLRGHFETISQALGTPSKYGFDIGYVIGKQYFHMNINMNTGMVGGAFFEFGYFGVILDPIMLVVSMRLFEKILLRANKEYVLLIALIYTSLAINSWAIWSQFIRISYFLLLIISLHLLFNKRVDEKTTVADNSVPVVPRA